MKNSWAGRKTNHRSSINKHREKLKTSRNDSLSIIHAGNMVHNIDTNKTVLTYLNSLTCSFQYYFMLGNMGTLVSYFTNIGCKETMATLDNWGRKKKKKLKESKLKSKEKKSKKFTCSSLLVRRHIYMYYLPTLWISSHSRTSVKSYERLLMFQILNFQCLKSFLLLKCFTWNWYMLLTLEYFD